MVQSSLPTATGCSSVATTEGGYSNLYWVHPDGTGLEQQSSNDQPDDVDYVGSSFSPKFNDRVGQYCGGTLPRLWG